MDPQASGQFGPLWTHMTLGWKKQTIGHSHRTNSFGVLDGFWIFMDSWVVELPVSLPSVTGQRCLLQDLVS